MKERTKKVVKIVSCIIVVGVLVGAVVLLPEYLYGKKEWSPEGPNFCLLGKFSLVYVDKVKDIVIFEIVIDHIICHLHDKVVGKDIYIPFPEKGSFDINGTNAYGYDIIVEPSSVRPVEHLFSHALMDIQPNGQLDNGDILMVYNASKYAGKEIDLCAWSNLHGTGEMYCTKGGIIPSVEEENCEEIN